MRKITITKAVKEDTKPLTVKDVPQNAYFRTDENGEWCKRTGSLGYPAVNLASGYLFTADFCNWIVREVLADGESLTIGPEVKDGQ